MSIDNANKLNHLLMGAKDGKLFFSAWLKANGYSDQLLRQYRTSGWLTMLSKGVMYRTGSKIKALEALSCYNEQLSKTFHVAAHSALELSGFSHYLPMGKPKLMVCHTKEERIPLWMKDVEFDREIVPFSTQIFTKQYTHIQTVNDFPLLVSSPEQAFLECLLLVPQQYNLMDLYYLMEQLTTLRAEVVQSLLEGCTNNKVKRLFLYMAEKANHNWFKDIDTTKIDLGTGKYQLSSKGVYLPKYKITMLQELHAYE